MARLGFDAGDGVDSCSTPGWRYRETRSDPPSMWKELTLDDTAAEWPVRPMRARSAFALVVTERNYKPAPVTPAEFEAGFSSDDFEWVEIETVGALRVDLTGVRFTKCIDFYFPNNWTIPPG